MSSLCKAQRAYGHCGRGEDGSIHFMVVDFNVTTLQCFITINPDTVYLVYDGKEIRHFLNQYRQEGFPFCSLSLSFVFVFVFVFCCCKLRSSHHVNCESRERQSEHPVQKHLVCHVEEFRWCCMC